MELVAHFRTNHSIKGGGIKDSLTLGGCVCVCVCVCVLGGRFSPSQAIQQEEGSLRERNQGKEEKGIDAGQQRS